MLNYLLGYAFAYATLIALASCLDLSHSIGEDTMETTTRPFDEFKNLEHLDQKVLPDVSHLADKFRDKAKFGHLVGMLDIWKVALLADGRFKVSKGKIS